MVKERKKISSSSSSSSSLSNSNRHFFKVFLPAFSTQRLKIPKSFMRNFNGVVPQKIILKASLGRFWHVELVKVGGDFFFQDGWQGFVKDHALQIGEILVFGYEGNSMFNVKIFDNSGCEKEEMAADREALIPWVIKEEEQTEAEETCSESIHGSKQNSGNSGKILVKCLADEDEYIESKDAEVNDIKEEGPQSIGSVKVKDAHVSTSPNQSNPDQQGLENVESESESFSERMNAVQPLRTINQENAKWKWTTQEDGLTKADLTETSSSLSLVLSDGNSKKVEPS